ncbi:MAG: hypothetical protein JXP34_24065 [Planctomycetes bacterium]|nr:hypothetical protein [Planctomycetota bacterium]
MRIILGALIVGIALIVLTTARAAPGAGRAPAYDERELGQYLPQWGDLKGVCANQATVFLIFQDGQGNLRRVSWNANGVGLRVDVLARKG